MKIKNLFIALLAVAALAGCNEEKLVYEPDGENNYMGFTISMPSTSTRAENTGGTGTYLEGEDYENTIKTLHFFFYRDGAYVSAGYGDMSSNFTPAASTGNVEEILANGAKGVVVLESTATIPNQVLCVVNSRNSGWYKNKSLATVLKALHTGDASSVTENTTDSFMDFQTAIGSDLYFVMLTSPMYGVNAKGVKEVKYVTDIFVEETTPGSGKFTAQSYIKNTKEDAENMPVEIYVERMAARLEITNLEAVPTGVLDASNEFFDVSKLDASMIDASGDPIWDIKPLSWSVTAANKKAYTLKHIDLGWFSKTGANEPFNGGWLQSGGTVVNVVDPASTKESMYTRINWAEDPNYSAPDFKNRNSYPSSARELLSESELKYWSANEIQANYDGAEASQADIRQRYCYENTFAMGGQTSPRVNGTMILLYAQAKYHSSSVYEDLYSYLGQMHTAKEYAHHLLSTMDANGHTFYMNDGGTYKTIHTSANFYDPANAYLKPVKATKIKDFFSNNPSSYDDLSTTYSQRTGHTSDLLLELYPDWVVDLTGSLQPSSFDAGFSAVPTPFPTAKVEKGYADGYVTLVPNTGMPTLYVEDMDTASNPAYDGDPTSNTRFRTATNAEIVAGFLGGVIEPANKYTEGRMYYAIPIEHFGKAKTAGTEPQLLEGNYGVVRNNYYSVAIGNIKSLGHGIDDVDEPIVPGEQKKPYYIAAKINILSWQVVTQTADLQE